MVSRKESRESKKSVTFSATQDELDAIDEAARKIGISRSQLILECVTTTLSSKRKINKIRFKMTRRQYDKKLRKLVGDIQSLETSGERLDKITASIGHRDLSDMVEAAFGATDKLKLEDITVEAWELIKVARKRGETEVARKLRSAVKRLKERAALEG